MGQISDITNPWRTLLLSAQASFRGVPFHVESGSLSGGRRTVVHEYPKRNDPYSEDMGRHATRWQFTGYLIYKVAGEDYVQQRTALIAALDADDAGTLIHPVIAAGGKLVMCERYSMTETRERGGYTAFDMAFVLAGNPGNSATSVNTTQNVLGTAQNAVSAAVTGFGGILGIT